MRRLRGFFVALAIALGLWTAAIETQSVTCGGSFVPSLNCTIPGLWNFTKVDPTWGFATPFQVGGAVATGLTSRVVDVGNTTVLALNTTPATIVPAPGVGYYVDVIAVDLAFKYTAAYAAGSDTRLFFSSRSAGNAASSTITTSGFLTATANAITHVAGIPDNTYPPTTNVPVAWQALTRTAFTGGDAANVVRVVVWYRIVKTGFAP